MTPRPFYLAGTFEQSGMTLDVISPYDGKTVATVAQAGKEHIDRALDAAVKALEETRALEPHQRKFVLDHIAMRLTERSEEFAKTLTTENGKTIREARAEVQRAISTFELAAGEAWTVRGETFDAGITPAGNGRRILVRPFPVGVVAGIAPFNFPLNLAAHKIAPAIATGCPIVLKPASKTPLSCLLLSEIIQETQWPKGAFSCLPCDREAGQMLVEDERVKLLSFTGSPSVGWKMKREAGKKKVILELGGNAGLIIDKGPHDWDWLISRTVTGGFNQCGQSCISVQRIFCHEAVYDEFKTRLLAALAKLRIGDPMDEKTDLGPIIDTANAKRINEWLEEAKKSGASIITGKNTGGTMFTPVVVENVDSKVKLSREEVFGPVVTIERIASVAEAVTKVNDSVFGLQCGLFSNDFTAIQFAYNTLEVGGVIINDVPSFRVDHMPYGGIKDSGLGREGIRYAMKDMQEEKAMVYFSPWTPKK